mgnify:CR=1 FL=1
MPETCTGRSTYLQSVKKHNLPSHSAHSSFLNSRRWREQLSHHTINHPILACTVYSLSEHTTPQPSHIMLRRSALSLGAKTLRSNGCSFRIPNKCNLPVVSLGHTHCIRKEAFQLRSLSSSKATESTSSTSDSERSLGKIEARPPGEKEYKSKFALPDKEKEQELGRLQNHVHDFFKAGHYTRALEAAFSLLEDT